MNITLVLYFAGIADKLIDGMHAGIVTAMLLTVAGLIACLAVSDILGKDAAFKLLKSIRNANLLVTLPMFAIYLAVPPKETIYYMAAGAVAQDVIADPQLQRISRKTLDAIESKLDDVKKSK